MTAEEYRTQINELGTAMKAITDKATAETRALTAEEEGKWDELDVKRDKTIKDEARAKKTAEIETGGERRSTPHQPNEYRGTDGRRTTQQTDPDPDEIRTAAIQAWMLGGTERRSVTYEAAARKAGISLDQRQLEIRLTRKPLTSLRHADVEAWEKRYLGVELVSPDNTGHFAVPESFSRALEVARLAFGGMTAVATVDRTEGGEPLRIPTLNDTMNEGVLIGEAIQETNDLEPTIGNVTLGAFTYSSKKVPMSVEFIQDNAIGAVERIGGIIGERLARIQNRHATVGTGSNQPNGIITAATSSGITTAGAAVDTYDNLVDLEHSVDPAYRPGARFMFNDTTLKILKKLKVPQFSGDAAGVPLWKAGMASGDPDTINGYPYTINQHVASGTGAKSIAFGDLSKYRIREVRGVQLVRLDELYAEYRLVVFLAWLRWDGDLLDAGTHPVKYLTQG